MNHIHGVRVWAQSNTQKDEPYYAYDNLYSFLYAAGGGIIHMQFGLVVIKAYNGKELFIMLPEREKK